MRIAMTSYKLALSEMDNDNLNLKYYSYYLLSSRHKIKFI